MNLIDDPLIILRDEIDDLFFIKFGKRSNDKIGKEIKYELMSVGKVLRSMEKEDNLNFEILGTYLYYLKYHFLNLWESFMKIKENNTDVFQKLKEIKDYNSIEFFFKFGFFCYIFMTNEIKKTIFDEQRYDLFWTEFYHFYSDWEFNKYAYKIKEFKKLKSEIESENRYLKLSNLDLFYKGKRKVKPEGRPAKITFEILMKYASLATENRINKKYIQEELYKMAVEDKMHWSTLRNWLRNNKPLLQKPSISIKELTKEDIIYMHEKSQEAGKK